jgi:hypothetical protein
VLAALALVWAAPHARAAGSYTLKSKVFAGSFDGFADRLTITAGDLDGDGDVDLIGGYAQGGLVYLRNPETHLPVSPPSITVLPGEPVAFTIPGYAGTSIWSFVANNSSGVLHAVSGIYTAGPLSGVIDLVQASDGAGLYGRAFVNVISPADVSAAGKAIVLAGRRSAADPLWPTTDYLSGQSFLTLRYRGFAKENIQFLSPVTGRDVDGNGLADDVDGLSTLAAAGAAVTNWAAASDRLFLHLIDHGGDSSGAGYFRLSETEVLTAAQLDAWLDALQDAHNTEVTLLIDCCYAGSFLDELGYSGSARRVVIAACGADEPTYFVAGGLVSFSDAFLSGTLLGLDVAQSFGLASNAMSAYQAAGMTDTAAGTALAVGSTFVAGRDIPQIGKLSPEQTLSGGRTETTLWAEQVVSVYPVQRVWALIVPPGHNPDPNNPVADLPRLELQMSGGAGRYEGTYSGFTQHGLYKIMVYAQDIWDSISLPRQTYVTQTGYDERVLLVGGGTTNDPGQDAIRNMANLAWRTFRSRWFTPEAIRYLAPDPALDVDADGTNDVTAGPSLAAVRSAITNWAAEADKLTVYLIGDSTNGAFRLNGAESLAAAELDGLLDAYQASNHAAIVVLEFDGSGSWVPALVPPAGRQRVTTASARATQAACRANQGLVSFCQYFLSDVFGGFDLGSAFSRAKEAVRTASGRLRQEPLLDDNGDGVANKFDGALARQWRIGSTFVTGADAPAVSTVMPPVLLTGSNSLLLWARAVADMDGISNVWCLVTPPDYAGEGDLPRVPLAWNPTTERYEAVYSSFTAGGTYPLTFQAQDLQGEICSPLQSEVLTADAYEPDDSAERAAPFEVGVPQTHNLHASNDADWVMLYAPAGAVFDIEAEQLGTNSDLALAVYAARPDGTLSNLTWLAVDDFGAGEGKIETTSVDLVADPDLEPGLYYVKVASADPALWGLDSEYELRIWVPVGGGGQLVVVAFDKLGGTAPPPGAVVVVDGVTTQSFGVSNSLALTLAAGAHSVTVPPVSGYRPEEDPRFAGQVTNPASYWFGNPKQSAVVDDQMRFAIFSFVPVIRAEGLVRDADTGGWVEGARVEFLGRSGLFSNTLYDGYPYGATYKSNWWSGATGQFPTNVWLPTAAWDLRLSHADYAARVWTGALPLLPRGTLTNLGVLALAPLDTNANGVADAWERRYFPQGGFGPTNDFDGDGSSDGREYFLGTDPTNALSVLAVEVPPEALTNGFRLRWPVVPGRTYELLTSGTLASDLWHSAAGPWTATGGQSQMSWQTNALPAATSRFFRINLVLP